MRSEAGPGSESPGESAGHQVRIAAERRETLVLGAQLERPEAIHHARATRRTDAGAVHGDGIGERRTDAALRAGANQGRGCRMDLGKPRLQIEIDDRRRQIEQAERPDTFAAGAVGKRNVGVAVGRGPARVAELDVLQLRGELRYGTPAPDDAVGGAMLPEAADQSGRGIDRPLAESDTGIGTDQVIGARAGGGAAQQQQTHGPQASVVSPRIRTSSAHRYVAYSKGVGGHG